MGAAPKIQIFDDGTDDDISVLAAWGAAHLAVDRFPDLGNGGFPGGCIVEAHNKPHFEAAEIWTAFKFLGLCVPAKRATVNSYGLKHAAEIWGERHGRVPYISNGALIVAACARGLLVERERGNSPNARIGVRPSSVEAAKSA